MKREIFEQKFKIAKSELTSLFKDEIRKSNEQLGKGTKSMIELAKKYGLEVHVYDFNGETMDE